MDFAVPADHRVKLNEIEKSDKYQYLDLARELKKQWNMKVMVMAIVNGVLVTVTKGLVKGMEDMEIIRRVKTIPSTALFLSPIILRRGARGGAYGVIVIVVGHGHGDTTSNPGRD